jgi:uncharacterized repeat protein (TIGR04138 family)
MVWAHDRVCGTVSALPIRSENQNVPEQKIDWKSVCQKAGPYPQEAFQFVREGLQHTVKIVFGEVKTDNAEDRHVTGQQLCLGLRDYALAKYGMLARTVLGRWGIQKTDDFGRIVFAMIDAGFMRKADSDSFEDFQGVFEFDESFASAEVA